MPWVLCSHNASASVSLSSLALRQTARLFVAEPSSVAHSGKKATAAASSAERGAHTETVTAQLAAALAGNQAHDSYLAVGLPPPEAQAPRVLSLSVSRPIAEATALCALTLERATLHSAAAVLTDLDAEPIASLEPLRTVVGDLRVLLASRHETVVVCERAKRCTSRDARGSHAVARHPRRPACRAAKSVSRASERD